MKKGMHKVENTGLNGVKPRSGYLTCEWLVGFAFMTLGSIIHVVVLPFCDLVVLSTITALGIVLSNFLSVTILKEKIVWRYDGPATLLIVFGSFLIVALSDYSETTFTPDDIKTLLWSTITLVSFSIAVIFTVCTII